MDEPHTLALIVAHPDDDAYGLAGTVALHEHDPGFRFILVHATDGGAGEIAPDYPASGLPLGVIRRRETANAWRAHGYPPDRHEWLDYDDGCVAGVDPDELAARVERILAEERPQVVATFGPDGITGHPDHIAVGAAVDAAFDSVRRTAGPGLRRLVHGALRRSTVQRWNRLRVRSGQRPWDPERIYDLRGVPDEWIGIEVDTSAAAARIVAGLKEHRTQRHVIFDPRGNDRSWQRLVSREPLVIAWPPRPPGQPVLDDVFAGIGQVPR